MKITTAKICPFRSMGSPMYDEDGHQLPVVYHTNGYPDDKPVLGIECCEEKCALWNEPNHCCDLARTVAIRHIIDAVASKPIKMTATEVMKAEEERFNNG